MRESSSEDQFTFGKRVTIFAALSSIRADPKPAVETFLHSIQEVFAHLARETPPETTVRVEQTQKREDAKMEEITEG